MHVREVNEVVRTKKAIRGEVPFTGTLGRRIYDYIFPPVFGPNGEVIAIAGTTRDNTERKATEDALQQSEERIQLALNSGIILGTWDWDVIHDRLIGDERFMRTFSVDNIPPGEPMHIAQVVESIHPDDAPLIQKKVLMTLARGDFYRAEYRVRKGDDWRWIEASGKIERNEEGQAIRFPGILVDIDDRKKIEQDLRALNDTLE